MDPLMTSTASSRSEQMIPSRRASPIEEDLNNSINGLLLQQSLQPRPAPLQGIGMTHFYAPPARVVNYPQHYGAVQPHLQSHLLVAGQDQKTSNSKSSTTSGQHSNNAMTAATAIRPNNAGGSLIARSAFQADHSRHSPTLVSATARKLQRNNTRKTTSNSVASSPGTTSHNQAESRYLATPGSDRDTLIQTVVGGAGPSESPCGVGGGGDPTGAGANPNTLTSSGSMTSILNTQFGGAGSIPSIPFGGPSHLLQTGGPSPQHYFQQPHQMCFLPIQMNFQAGGGSLSPSATPGVPVDAPSSSSATKTSTSGAFEAPPSSSSSDNYVGFRPRVLSSGFPVLSSFSYSRIYEQTRQQGEAQAAQAHLTSPLSRHFTPVGSSSSKEVQVHSTTSLASSSAAPSSGDLASEAIKAFGQVSEELRDIIVRVKSKDAEPLAFDEKYSTSTFDKMLLLGSNGGGAAENETNEHNTSVSKRTINTTKSKSSCGAEDSMEEGDVPAARRRRGASRQDDSFSEKQGGEVAPEAALSKVTTIIDQEQKAPATDVDPAETDVLGRSSASSRKESVFPNVFQFYPDAESKASTLPRERGFSEVSELARMGAGSSVMLSPKKDASGKTRLRPFRTLNDRLTYNAKTRKFLNSEMAEVERLGAKAEEKRAEAAKKAKHFDRLLRQLHRDLLTTPSRCRKNEKSISDLGKAKREEEEEMWKSVREWEALERRGRELKEKLQACNAQAKEMLTTIRAERGYRDRENFDLPERRMTSDGIRNMEKEIFQKLRPAFGISGGPTFSASSRVKLAATSTRSRPQSQVGSPIAAATSGVVVRRTSGPPATGSSGTRHSTLSGLTATVNTSTARPRAASSHVDTSSMTRVLAEKQHFKTSAVSTTSASSNSCSEQEILLTRSSCNRDSLVTENKGGKVFQENVFTLPKKLDLTRAKAVNNSTTRLSSSSSCSSASRSGSASGSACSSTIGTPKTPLVSTPGGTGNFTASRASTLFVAPPHRLRDKGQLPRNRSRSVQPRSTSASRSTSAAGSGSSSAASSSRKKGVLGSSRGSHQEGGPSRSAGAARNSTSSCSSADGGDACSSSSSTTGLAKNTADAKPQVSVLLRLESALAKAEDKLRSQGKEPDEETSQRLAAIKKSSWR
ncbi:unnamed protein product [Amoebophrya sp. A25]|nr:unnamed protein product [Amoebophrya sp. A25]|eukprot:GSA25T00025635001.1